MIEIDQDSCRNLETALSREWLDTNGIGGFSSSTIVGWTRGVITGCYQCRTESVPTKLVIVQISTQLEFVFVWLDCCSLFSPFCRRSAGTWISPLIGLLLVISSYLFYQRKMNCRHGDLSRQKVVRSSWLPDLTLNGN